MTQPAILTKENSAEIFGAIPRPSTVPEFKFSDELPLGYSETFLLYGSTGSGKTRICGTCGDRTLFINNGIGVGTIQSPRFQADVGSRPIVVSLFEKLGKRGIFDTAQVHDAICDTIDFALEKFPERFDFICIDDGTQLRRGAMNKALEIMQATGKSNTLKNIVEKYDVMSSAVQDYGQEMSIVETFIASYSHICKQAGKHFVFCAHERMTFKKGENIGEAPVLIRTAPAFTGVDKNPSQMSNYFDNVWHTEVVGGGDNRLFRVTTVGHEQLAAKTRMDGVFKVVEPVPAKGHFMLNVIKRIREASPDKLPVKK